MHLLFRAVATCLLLLPTIACRAQEPLPTQKPQGSEKAVTLEDFHGVLGENIFSLKFMELSKRLGKEPQIRLSCLVDNAPPQLFTIYWEHVGINLHGRRDLIIQDFQIIVDKWKGDLPLGFQKTTSVEDVRKTLGKPDFFVPSIYGKKGTVLRYGEKGINLHFYPTDKAKERMNVGPDDPSEAIEVLGVIIVFDRST